jgi:hypothetical protein
MMIGLLLAGLMACSDDKKTNNDDSGFVRDTDSQDTDTQDSQDTQDTNETDTNPPDTLEGMVTGTIDIQLFVLDDEGEREMITWEDAYDTFYPFGKIFVAAYYENEQEGRTYYVGYDVIEDPQQTGNAYSIPVEVPDPGTQLRIFAVLDYHIDNITGTDEPIGGYSRTVSFEDSTADLDNMRIDGIDFSILSPMHEVRPPCENDREITVDGEVTLTEIYTGGDIAVILNAPGNIGPVHHSIVTPEVFGGGAQANYEINSCEGLGYMLLKGIWDENRNGMFDPMDEFGSYISEPNQSGNPMTVGYSNLSDYEIQVPLNSGSSGLSLVPFVQLSGTVSPFDGLFDEIATSGTLYIAALKYRPSGEISLDTLDERSYDYQVVPWSELQGKSNVEWRITVPSETITYLWAYLDSDDNGYVNEPQEPVASGGEDDNGKFPTGNYATNNIDMILIVME